MALVWNTATIIKIEQASSNTRRFWFEVQEGPIQFKAGQFVTLDLPIHEQKNKRWRSYSIASAPNGSNIFELVIVLLPGGLGTQYLFNEATIGTQIPFRGPQGVFTLPDSIDTDLYFICTGTGIAPFRSMIHYLHQQKIPHQNIHLVFGGRTQADCLYAAELIALQDAEAGFYYHPCISREQNLPKGYTHGYVHGVYEQLAANNPNAQFYLCGWKNMVDEARNRLSNLGYDKKAVHFELYG